MPPPAAPGDAKLADSNDDDSRDDDDVEVYMLAESRRFYSYRNECPPFVLKMTQGFGEKATAFSPRALRGEVRGLSDGETERPDHDSPQEQSDVENEIRSVDATQPSSMRRHPSRNAKGKGQAKMKHLIAEMTGTDREGKAKRESRQPRVLLEQKPDAQARAVTNNAATADRSSLPTPPSRLLPSQSTSHSQPARVPMKRERSVSEGAARQPPQLSTRLVRQRLRSPSVIEVSNSAIPSIDRYKQSHTTLHISPSKNDDGAVPFYLHSCMTIETFFASARSVWRLRDKDEEVAAMTVRFDWLKKAEAMIVMREVADSFQKMLETIAEAPLFG